jgi:hypothetical protein
VGANPATIFEVSFVNTPAEQWLKLGPANLQQIMNDIGQNAERSGLTPEILESLLRNE